MTQGIDEQTRTLSPIKAMFGPRLNAFIEDASIDRLGSVEQSKVNRFNRKVGFTNPKAALITAPPFAGGS